MTVGVRNATEEGTIVSMEYIGTPERERRRVPGLVLASVLLLAAGAATFLWWADSVARTATLELATAFSASDSRAASGERQVQGTVAYASPMIWSTSVPEDVRASLRALVEETAADVAGDLAAIEEQAAAILVLPWQEPQLAARQEVLDLIEDQRARFAGISEDAGNIDMILADGPLPTGAALASLRASGAADVSIR